jgi:hypothetical protein
MLRKAGALWVLGMLTAVPYATWYLFFRAPREQYALLITFVLFWIFGYWGIVGPIMSLVKVRRVFRAIENAGSREEIMAILRSNETKDVAIDHIASEYRIPRFLARRVVGMVAERVEIRSDLTEGSHRIDAPDATTGERTRPERD